MYKIDIVCYFSDCSIILLQEFVCDFSKKSDYYATDLHIFAL